MKGMRSKKKKKKMSKKQTCRYSKNRSFLKDSVSSAHLESLIR